MLATRQRNWINHMCRWGCIMEQPHWQQLAVSYKIKYAFIVQPSDCILGSLSQRKGKVRSQKNLHMNVHSTCTYNSQNVLYQVNGYQILMYPYLGILLNNRKEQTYWSTRQPGWLSWELQWVKNPPHTGFLLYDFIYITILKQNYFLCELMGL